MLHEITHYAQNPPLKDDEDSKDIFTCFKHKQQKTFYSDGNLVPEILVQWQNSIIGTSARTTGIVTTLSSWMQQTDSVTETLGGDKNM